MDTFPIEVRLAVTAADLHAVVDRDDGGLPRTTLGAGESTREVAEHLFGVCCGFRAAQWLVLRQVGFFDLEGDRKAVLYAVEMPERVPLDPGLRWEPAERIGPEAAAMLHYACHKLRF